MKVVFFNKTNKFLWTCLSVIIVFVLILNIVGYFLSLRSIKIFAESDKYEVRSRLLMDAMNFVGTCTPEDAVDVWSKGIISRSGAMQYSVMTEELKKVYVPQLEEFNENWVTGISSPYVTEYEIVRADTPNETTRTYEMLYKTATGADPAENYKAVLTVIFEGKFWRISKINMDEGLYAYTGFSG